MLEQWTSPFLSRSEAQRIILEQAVINGLADWIRPFPWRLFVLLTFWKDVSGTAAANMFNHFILEVERTDPNLLYAGVIETLQGHSHIHLLMGGLVGPWIEDYWKAGLSWFAVFDPRRGGVQYIARKAIHEDHLLIPTDIERRHRRYARYQKVQSQKAARRAS